MKEEFRQIREKLGEKGASARAAKEICNYLGVIPHIKERR
jgi:hypothetical protein